MAVVISSALVASATVPIANARIGYRKITGTITASTAASGFAASNADNEMTYSFWKPTAMPATWEIDAGTAVDVDYFGIAAHTCGTDQATVYVEYWDGTAWVEIDNTLPGDDSPLMFLLTGKFASKYRVRVTGTTAPRIGVIYIGETLAMQRPIADSHSPINLSRKTVTSTNLSENGQWLGRSIIRKGSATNYQWKNLTSTWYRANFDPFVEHARTKPFFLAWHPEEYPSDVGYLWLPPGQDIQPSYQGQRDFISVGFPALGYGND